MTSLKFADNIIKMRRDKGITQDELAGFLGITKASVSKWETKQSLPDILLLPRIAAFFDISVDELLGYEPQLSKEQIKKYYHDFAADFAEKPFEDVMQKTEQYVKKYYSCYPFLFQICILWLNHFMIAESENRKTEILQSIYRLCGHILDSCKDIGICNDAVYTQAAINLQLGKPQDVIDEIEETLNPYRLQTSSESLLIQSYLMTGNTDKADSFTQISMFQHVMSLVSCSIHMLTIHMTDFSCCQQIIERTDGIFSVFDIDHLHPNTAAGYHYQAAAVYSAHGMDTQVYERLEKFARISGDLLKNGVMLRSDAFFQKLDNWFEQCALGAEAVRDKRLIAESAVQALDNPVFAAYKDTEHFRRFKNIIRRSGGFM